MHHAHSVRMAPLAAALLLAAGAVPAADCNGNSIDDDTEFLAGANVAYQVDNNTHTTNWGMSGTADSLWMNTFEVQAGGEYITELTAYFNEYWTRGERTSLLLFADPNNDGVPDDAVLLDQVEMFLDGTGWKTATLSPPVKAGEAGDKFFVGMFNSANHQRYPASSDDQTTIEGTWAVAWARGDVRFHVPGTVYSLDPTKISEALLIRATGRSAAVDCNANGKLDACDPACGSPVVKSFDVMHVNPLGPGQAQFQIVFSEPVVGLDTTDLLMTASPTMTGHGVAGVEFHDGGARCIVTVDTGSGWGDITLFLLDNDTITDVDGNGISGLTTGPICQVDARVATVSSAVQLDPDVVTSGPVTYRLTYDAPVSGALPAAYIPTTFGPTSPSVLSVTPLVANPFDGAVSFDKATEQHAQAPAGIWFFGTFTVEAWIYPRDHGNWARIMDFGDGPADDNVLLAYSAGTSGYISGDIWKAGTVQRVMAPARIPLNQWSHVAWTYDGVDGHLYLNGVEVARAPLHAPAVAPRNTCYIAHSNWTTDADADVIVDEFRIWVASRSREEIVTGMEAPISPSSPGLLGYWKFDEGTGTTVNDETSGGNDLTLVNAPTWVDSDAPGVDQYDVELTAAGEGWLRLDSSSSTGPRNAAGRAVVFADAEPYLLDANDPEVASISRLDDQMTNVSEVRWAVEFTEAVEASSTTDYAISEAGTLAGSSIASAHVEGATCVAFDGIDDYVRVPDLAQSFPTHEITIEYWQYIDELKPQAVCSMSRDNTRNRVVAHTPWSDGKVYWDFGDIYGGGRISYTPPASLVGSWNHFALVASDAQGAMRVYRNGILEAEQFTSDTFENYEADFFVGRLVGRYLHGRVRDFRVWNYARDGAEIADDHDRTLSGGEPGLVLHLPLVGYEDLGVNGDGADDLRDLAFDGNHADSLGSPLVLPVNQPHIVTVSTGTGTGELELDLVDVDAIRDFADRTLGGAGVANGDFAGSDPYFIDTDAPGIWFDTVPATKAGGSITGTWGATDNGGSGVAGAVVHGREKSGTWADDSTAFPSGDTDPANGTFSYSPSADGVYHIGLSSVDNLGNAQDYPEGTESIVAEAIVLYNDVPNSTFTHSVPSNIIAGTYVFPMEDGGITVTVQLFGVTAAGTLTVSRVEDHDSAVGRVQEPDKLINQGIVIEASPSLQFASANVVLPYEESLLNGLLESEVNAATSLGDGGFRRDFHGLVANEIQNTVTITGVTHFSEWYLGNSSALPVELDAFSVD